MVLEVSRRAGYVVGLGYQFEIAVHSPFGADYGARGESSDYVREVKNGQEAGDKVFDSVRERACPVLGGLVHRKGSFAGPAEEVVVDKRVNGIVEQPERHHRLRAEREPADDYALWVNGRLPFHPVKYDLVLPRGEPEIAPSGFEKEPRGRQVVEISVI